MMQAMYEVDGRINYKNWPLTCKDAKQRAKEMMRTGKYEFIEVKHMPDLNTVIYLRRRKWGGYPKRKRRA